MSLAEYLNRFSCLRTYRDRKKWPALTIQLAHHKPFLLLLIMDLIIPSSRRKKKVSGWLRINFTGTGEIYFADE